MLTLQPVKLAAGLRRAAVWAIMPKLPVEFTSIRKAVKFLQGKGYGYHYQTMQNDISTAFQRHKLAPLQVAVPVDEYIPKDLFIEKHWKGPHNYYYYGSAKFLDTESGLYYDHAYSVYVDTALTQDELMQVIWEKESDRLAADKYGKNWEVVGFEVEEAYHKWGAPTSQGFGGPALTRYGTFAG